MYKIIVVDDETWICKLIRKILNWEDLGFQIVADAGDGASALSLIKEHRPDLVITDIRMPSLDGIGLIKAVRELSIETEFIIVSGYSDFEYARSAVKFDVFGYIVKPLDKEELTEILLSVKEKIQKKSNLKTKIEISDSQMLEQKIKKIIDHKDKNVSIEELNSQYGTNFSEGEFCVAVLKQDFSARERCENYVHTDYIGFLSNLKETHSEELKELVYYIDSAGGKAVFIINFTNKEHVQKEMRRVLELFREQKELKEHFDLTIGIGDTVSNIKQIGKSYRTAMCAINARMIIGTGTVIEPETQLNRFSCAKDLIDVREVKKLAFLLDVLDTKGASEEIANILKQAEKQLSKNAVVLHLVAYEIIAVLFKVMSQKEIQVESLTKEMAELKIENSLSKSKIESTLNQLVVEFSRYYTDARQESGDKLIRQIKTFIMENYMQDISLDDVAKLVCLNPTYVSEVFKKRTNENFSEYLSDYRISIAKELLKDIRYKIIDVSIMVGYKDSKYFSRLFNKKVGVNPTDYRKLYV